MTVKRMISIILLVVLLLIILVPVSPVHRVIRTYFIYKRYESRIYNSGENYIFNKRASSLATLPWGISKANLRFLISSRLYKIEDWENPVSAEFYEETENSVSYIFSRNFGNTCTRVFYFNPEGKFYRVVEKHGTVSLHSFIHHNTHWLGKRFAHTGVSQYELKWKNDNTALGFEHHISKTGAPLSALGFNIENFINTSFEEFPEFEILYLAEFKGMRVEHSAVVDPNNPRLLINEVVYTSTFLSSDLSATA